MRRGAGVVRTRDACGEFGKFVDRQILFLPWQPVEDKLAPTSNR